MKIHLEIIFQFFPPLKKGIKGPEDITYYVIYIILSSRIRRQYL